MIVRFFPHGSKKDALKNLVRGTSGCDALLNYLDGDTDKAGRKRPGAVITLKGDNDTFEKAVKYGKCPEEYTSGALRFNEIITNELKQKAINEFERMIFPGLLPHQYVSLWKEHPHTDNTTELHFSFAKIETETGNRLDPWVYKIDLERIQQWSIAFNAEHNLIDPNHPAHKQIMSKADIKVPLEQANSKEAIDDEVERRINKGLITNRASLLKELETIDGIEKINRVSKNFISVVVEGRKLPIRLKGRVYEADFESKNFTSSKLEQEIAAYEADRENRAKRARKEAERLHDIRAKENKKRYKPHEGKVLQAELYALVDDKILTGDLTSRKQVVEFVRSQDKVIEVVDTEKHHISVYYEGGARPFRMTGEPYKREGNIDDYLQTLLDSKEKSDHKLEERRRQEEAFYFNKEFGRLDFVRMKDTKWNEFAKTMQNEDAMKEHINLKYDIMFNQSDNITKTNIEANSDMTEFDLSIFRAYANDPNFELTDDNNNKENENGIDYKRNNERTERIIKELVERKQTRRSFSQYIKDTFDGIKGSLKSISRNYRRGYEDIRNTRQKTERYGEELRRKIDSNREKARNNDRAFTETIRAFEEQLTVMEKQASYNKKKGSDFRPN